MPSADNTPVGPPKHLPYEIAPQANRAHFYENYWKRVGLGLLLKHCPADGRTVLDYGCGRGEALQSFGEAGFQISGTDTDPECVRRASRFGSSCLLDPENPVDQFGENAFSVVTCFHVLEHVENPKRTLTHIGRIAEHYVLLAVPNLRYLHRLFERRFELDQINEGHLQSWDHWHLRNLAERHCQLQLVEWASDATALPGLSQFTAKVFGNRMAIRLETGLFRRLFPYHCISVIGLFRVSANAPTGAPDPDAVAARARPD